MKKAVMHVCAFFFRRLASLNNRFDKIQEPKRFYTFLTLIVAPIIILQIFEIATKNPWYEVASWLFSVILIGIRLWWISGDLKDWIPVKKNKTEG